MHIWLMVLLMILGLAVPGGIARAADVESVDYGAFKMMVRQGQIGEATVGPRRIEARTRSEPPRTVTTVLVPDAALVPLLERHEVTIRGEAVGGGGGGDWAIWLLPVMALLLIWGLWGGSRQAQPPGGVAGFGRSRARVVLPGAPQTTSFRDVAGVPEAKAELAEVVDFLREPDRYTGLGGRLPRGILLVGPPGTGKTLLAKAVAGEAGVPFFALSGSEFVELFVGVGAGRVRDLFRQAREKAPCVIFIDELDALGRVRASHPMAVNEERDQTLNQLLAEMDGFDSVAPVMVLSATNRPEVLDPALLRPGRFDRQVTVDRPDQIGREQILRVHAAKVRLGDDVKLAELARRTTGMSGAELANVINEGALLAGRARRPAVTMPDLSAALERVVAGLERPHLVLDPGERHRVSVHESGHALAACLLPGADPVARVSLVPRGTSGLGYTWQLPEGEKRLFTRSNLLDRVCVLLAGRAAEELVLGEPSTGSADDLQRATDMVRALICQAGLGEQLGQQAFASPDRFMPGSRGALPMGISEATAARIDGEVQSTLETAAARVRGLMSERLATLCRLAQVLREQEQLEGEQVRAIVAEAGWQERRAA
ncbi:MAG: ATP-dependent zinc metalloprotease FtsH [Candidatus Sericytochromatia bacterium]|nr:ATP-dependent zinc metalloprotease FtsH [Candidatus Sericytochromatia bacterium]